MAYKLIAFDLDGTLLDDNKDIPDKNMRALEEATARGLICVPATGRVATGIPENLRKLPFIRYYVVSNGAAVYDMQSGEALYRAEISTEDALRLCDYMDGLPVIYDCFQQEQGFMTESMYRRVPEYFADMPVMCKYVLELRRPVDSLPELIRRRNEPLQKMQMFFMPEDFKERRRQFGIMPKLFPELKISSSLPNNIEINAAGADKWLAVSALCRYLGIDPRDTVCFGDASNDLSMLRGAGLGVAMGNAEPEAKAAARTVTGVNNEGGVGQMILRLLEEI